MNSLLNWNEAKLTFKYQSFSIASVGAVNMNRHLMSSLRYKSNAMMIHELLKFLNFHADF